MSLLALPGCESDEERAARVWTETFGEVAAQYNNRLLAGSIEMDPRLVRGRKVLVDTTPPLVPRSPASYEATTADEVGLVVVDATVTDPAPSVTYEGGGRGYGGQVTEAAFAHPEGKLVYLKTRRCEPDAVTLGVTTFGSGMSTHSSDNTCGGSRDSRLRHGGQLVGAIQQLGDETDAESAKAYEALLAAAEAHLSEAVAPTLPDLAGRRVLHLSPWPDGSWKVAQEARFLPAGRTAMNVAEVGLVAFDVTTWEAAPSRTYAHGVPGYAGTTTYVAVAMPEAVVVGRASAPCELPPDRPGDSTLQAHAEVKCKTDPKTMKDWLAGLVGQDAAAKP